MHHGMLRCAPDDALRALVRELSEIQSDFSAAVEQLRGVTDRYRRSRKPSQLRCDCNSVVASTARIVRREVERVAQFHVEVGASCEVAMDATVLAQICCQAHCSERQFELTGENSRVTNPSM